MERSWWYRLTVILLFFGINSSAQILPAVLDLDTYGVTTRRLNIPTAASSTTPNYARYTGATLTTQNITVECWARINNVNSTHNTQEYIISDRAPLNYEITYQRANKRIIFRVRNNPNTINLTSGDPATDSTLQNIQSNTWYHIAGVCDCTSIVDTCQLTVYIDGVAGTTAKFYEPNGRLTTSTQLTVGTASITNINEAFYGQVDEIRLWDHARTSEQINRYMKKRLRCPESGLVAYYTLNEGSGSTGADCAGTAQNLTLFRNAAFITN